MAQGFLAYLPGLGLWNSCMYQRKGFLTSLPKYGAEREGGELWVLNAVSSQTSKLELDGIIEKTSFCRDLATSSLVLRERLSKMLGGLVDSAMIITLK